MTTFAIVGAGRGLGASVARRFASEGFDVALVSRNAERVESLAADLREEVSAPGATSRTCATSTPWPARSTR